MDIKIEIKQEDPLSNDATSQNEGEIFTKNVIVETNRNAVFLDEHCDMAVKSETSFPDLYSQKERGILSEESVTLSIKKYDSDHEMDNKIKVKEEPFGLETDTSAVCDNIEDGNFTAIKSQRFCTETVSGDINADSPLTSAESSMENSSFHYGNESCKCVESDVTKTPSLKDQNHPKEFGKCSNGEIENSTLLIHKGELSLKCNICNKSFTHLSSLKRHALLHEGLKPHQCDICQRSFTRLSDLKTHYLIHEGKKPHRCQICEKRFTRLSHLQTHKSTHEGKKPHKCKFCEKRFTRLSNLKRHNWIHEGKKPHKCEICEKMFARLSHLENHHLIHEGKLHKCEICEKRFIKLSSLENHNLIHQGKMPHKCEICEKGFNYLSDFKRHNLIHEGKKPHKCKICVKGFTHLSSLKRHNLIHEDI